MKDAFSQSLTTRNDTIWPVWQIWEEAAGRLLHLPVVSSTEKLPRKKPFCPFQLWDRVQPTHLYMNKRSWSLTWGGSMKDQRKQSQRTMYSGARLGFFEAYKVTHVLHTHHITYICSVWWERHKDVQPPNLLGEKIHQQDWYILCWARGLCKMLRDTNQWLQEKFKIFTKAAVWESSLRTETFPRKCKPF